ncbi:hypothetical protein [Gimesia maris]|uniref:HEAT repeat domain-containing protein n=1 Tax=Gimesia maris TaxID=122 RepID=A0ABX5YKH5_9PLAN|nr:hypothetical protein [Gimesia maris]EDL57447.1 hypothetical protein PM8797T_02079 [Gimesia maris DSM 8797]QEG16144.1 hypothetical protein GmarT_20050 [Gimesia maris]QGQ30623.1 hypothetical protein F1729_19295 [Gimesia maris]
MKSIETELIVDLRSGVLTSDEFFARFPSKIDSKYLTNELEAALMNHDSDVVEDLFFLGFKFSLFTSQHIKLLCLLLNQGWHRSHEDVASILQTLKSPESVDALFTAVNTRYDYLFYDDSTALAVKCVWALSGIDTEESRNKIEFIANHDTRDEVKQLAISKLLKH